MNEGEFKTEADGSFVEIDPGVRVWDWPSSDCEGHPPPGWEWASTSKVTNYNTGRMQRMVKRKCR